MCIGVCVHACACVCRAYDCCCNRFSPASHSYYSCQYGAQGFIDTSNKTQSGRSPECACQSALYLFAPLCCAMWAWSFTPCVCNWALLSYKDPFNSVLITYVRKCLTQHCAHDMYIQCLLYSCMHEYVMNVYGSLLGQVHCVKDLDALLLMDWRGKKEKNLSKKKQHGKRGKRLQCLEAVARRVKKGIAEERDRMREKEEGGEKGIGWEGNGRGRRHWGVEGFSPCGIQPWLIPVV